MARENGSQRSALNKFALGLLSACQVADALAPVFDQDAMNSRAWVFAIAVRLTFVQRCLAGEAHAASWWTFAARAGVVCRAVGVAPTCRALTGPDRVAAETGLVLPALRVLNAPVVAGAYDAIAVGALRAVCVSLALVVDDAARWLASRHGRRARSRLVAAHRAVFANLVASPQGIGSSGLARLGGMGLRLTRCSRFGGRLGTAAPARRRRPAAHRACLPATRYAARITARGRSAPTSARRGARRLRAARRLTASCEQEGYSACRPPQQPPRSA
jgi:hypothetical protein